MESVVRRTRGRLLSISRRIGAPQDAEDTVQAAYHALLRHGAFREPVTVEAWLTTAVVRIAYRRKALAQQEAHLAERLARDRGADPHTAAAGREEIALLRHAVAKLPAKYRDVLVLRHLEGLSVAETGRLLNLPDATVKTRTRRGLTILKARVAPWAAWALLAGPWLLADGVRSTAQWGIVMNVKTTVTMSAVALAAAVVGVGVGMSATFRNPAERREHTSEGVPRSPVTVEKELAAWRERAEEAERQLAEIRTPGREAARNPEEPVSDFDRRYAAAGKEVGAGSAALAAIKRAKTAWDARRSGSRSTELDSALRALDAFGGEAFLATVAHLRADENPEGTGYTVLFRKTWKPGLEAYLLSLAQDSEAKIGQRSRALLCLAATDTPQIREHLLSELERDGEPELVFAAGLALGRLHEDRAIPALERVLSDTPSAAHTRALQVLGTLGSERARNVLLHYVEKDHPGLYLVSGVRVLSWLDKDAGREVATRILAGWRAANLTDLERRALAAMAKK